MKCELCRYAILGCEELYGTTDKEWFVGGCMKGRDQDDCDGPYREDDE